MRGDTVATTRGAGATAEVLTRLREAFRPVEGFREPVPLEGARMPGETQVYADMGYRPLVGVVGAHPLHHTPRDLPDATGPELLEPVARALAAVVRSVS